jgi:hypothetical protein
MTRPIQPYLVLGEPEAGTPSAQVSAVVPAAEGTPTPPPKSAP